MLDHLFCGVALSGCFLLKSSFVKLAASNVKAKRCSKLSYSEICDQNCQKTWRSSLFVIPGANNVSVRTGACNFFNINETEHFIKSYLQEPLYTAANMIKSLESFLLLSSFFAMSLTLVSIQHFFSFVAASIFQDPRDLQLLGCFIYSYLQFSSILNIYT